MNFDMIVGNFLDLGYELQDILEAIEDSNSDEEIKEKLDSMKETQKKIEEFKIEIDPEDDKKIEKKLQEKIQAAEMKNNLKENTFKENSIKDQPFKTILEDSSTQSAVKVLRPLFKSLKPQLFKSTYFTFSLLSSKKPKLRKICNSSAQKLQMMTFKVNDAGPYLTSKRYSIHLKESSKSTKQYPESSTSDPKNVIPSKKTETFKIATLKTLNEKPSEKINLVYADPTTGGIILSQPEENDPVAPDPTSDYFKVLSQYRVIESSDPLNFWDYNFKDPVNLSPQACRRISQEIKTLEKSLPCDAEASIFFMYDHEDMGKLRVLVSGPSGTVYAHGLYLFDVRLPADYPRSPPLVHLCTTGNGKVRFNPNLYHNGKVCLSIINTWPGSRSEQWNPSTSTLLQVFLSIQAMVMGNRIIQNEPTFESYAEDSPENVSYQYEVRYGNLKYAIINNLQKPPKGFEDVVHDHFLVLRSKIVKYAEHCLELSKTFKPNPVKSQNFDIQMIFSGPSVYKIFQGFLFELQEIIKNKFIN